jgi:hypothetical protein
MRAWLATQPARADRDNEDFAVVTASAAVLLDGAGIPDGLPSGCVHGVAWYARMLGTSMLAEISGAHAGSLRDGLRAGISQVRGLHEGTCGLDHRASPSATVIAVRVTDGVIEHLVLADSVLVIEHGNRETVITDRREAQIGRGYRADLDAAPAGTAEHEKALRAYIQTLQAHRNQPGGFWVASAEPAAADEALTGEQLARDVQALLLLSDGASRLADRFGQMTWSQMISLARDKGPGELIGQTRACEAADPQGHRWPRGKTYDDATAVYCDQLA